MTDTPATAAGQFMLASLKRYRTTEDFGADILSIEAEARQAAVDEIRAHRRDWYNDGGIDAILDAVAQKEERE